jgi:type III pantothenate kinase
MILALDAGNSRIKWGCYDSGEWIKTGAIIRAEIETLPSVLAKIPPPQQIVVSNVAGMEIREKIANAIAQFGIDAYWPKPAKACCGVRNGYDNPEQLGSDRWAALIGARRAQPGAVLVVNAGTALTIDTLTDAGEFLGGVILPGIGMMMRGLTTGTAHAHAAYGDFVTFPTTTTDAIYSGALNAALGAIERMRAAFANRSATPLSCLITGGAASVLLPHLSPPVQEIPNLVMLGLVTMMQAKA